TRAGPTFHRLLAARPMFHREPMMGALNEDRAALIWLRAGAFLDRSRDVVASKVRKGVAPGVAMSMIYMPDLARYAAKVVLDLLLSVLNQSVDICCDVPATGSMVSASFSKILRRPMVARPVFPRLLTDS